MNTTYTPAKVLRRICLVLLAILGIAGTGLIGALLIGAIGSATGLFDFRLHRRPARRRGKGRGSKSTRLPRAAAR